MKKIISVLLLITICFTFAVVPAAAQNYTKQTGYDQARKYVLSIDFEYFLSSENIGDDIAEDLKNINEYISSHKNYTLDDLNEIIKKANTSDCVSTCTRYDYTKLLPTSKDVLNANEKEVFNSNPTYGLLVLLQASFANSQEAGRFGSNTRGTNGDAFRHSLWNALGTHYTSESYMKRFATAYETGSPNYDPNSIDTKMDIQNNATGRSLVKKMNLPNNPSNGMVIPYLVSNNIATATKNGKLVRFVVGTTQYSTLKATNSATSN